MSDVGPGAIKLAEGISQNPGRATRAQFAASPEETIVTRAIGLRRDCPGAARGESHGSRLAEGKPSAICTGFVTDERLTTANAAE